MVEVNGLDLDVREEGVLVEMEPVREELVVHISKKYLERVILAFAQLPHDILRRNFECQPCVALR